MNSRYFSITQLLVQFLSLGKYADLTSSAFSLWSSKANKAGGYILISQALLLFTTHSYIHVVDYGIEFQAFPAGIPDNIPAGIPKMLDMFVMSW